MRKWVFHASVTLGLVGSWTRVSGAQAVEPTTPGLEAAPTAETPDGETTPEVVEETPVSAATTPAVDAPLASPGAGEEQEASDSSETSIEVHAPRAVAMDEGARERTGGDDEPSGPEDAPKMELRTRIMGGFRYQDEEPNPEATYGFRLRQVRTSFRLRWKKKWYTRATVDFADGLNPGTGVQYLRTAALEYRHSKELRFTVGRFKRPFSYLELQSTGDLPILSRGLLNDLVVEDSAWGDRSIGMMVSGKHKDTGLGWKVAVTNPNRGRLIAQGVDTIARLEWDVTDELQVGVNGGNKYLDVDEGRQHFQAVGGDVRVRLGALEWQVEGMVADQPWRQNVAGNAGLAYGATTFVSYTQPISDDVALVPVVFGEYADANSDYGRNESVRFQGGLNVVIKDQFRIMPQIQVTRAVGEPLRSAPPSSAEFHAINPWMDGTRLALYFSLAL